jgi:site-specific DNA-methyltransferase (adenine-specific)
LPEWFIKLFTKPGDTVLDPFSGSGTSMRVARDLGRNGLGIELLDEYCELTANELGLASRAGKIYDAS